jgi:S-disulfanyl-L-cysteine oxidoreductase SoxD
MYKPLLLIVLALPLAAQRTPSPAQIAEWDISISTTGAELPKGSGSVAEGKEFFANRCGRCHGPKGEGKESVAIAGGQGTLKNPKPLRTVGSFWPHATTVWDYINRAMPFDKPGTLSPGQVYSLTAYVLFLNGIVPENATLDAASLPKVQMPNRNGFVPDTRPDVGAKPRKK